MTGTQSPQMVTDLYRDLRDRKLLPLVVVLVVGIAVVPLALKSSSETPPPAPLPTPVASKSNVPPEAVVVSEPGLRDYKRRLKDESAVDPFVQKFLGSAAPPEGPAGADSAETLGAVAPSDVTSAGSTAGTTAGTTGGATSTPQTVQTEVRTDNKVVFYRLKIRSGPLGGEMNTKSGVGPSAQLPNASVPALAFLGANFNGDLEAQRAYFLVSNGVSSISGDGVCGLGDPCQLVSVRPGEYVDLVWTDGLTYRVKLLAFERHVRDQVPGDFVPESGSGSSGRSGK